MNSCIDSNFSGTNRYIKRAFKKYIRDPNFILYAIKLYRLQLRLQRNISFWNTYNENCLRYLNKKNNFIGKYSNFFWLLLVIFFIKALCCSWFSTLVKEFRYWENNPVIPLNKTNHATLLQWYFKIPSVESTTNSQSIIDWYKNYERAGYFLKSKSPKRTAVSELSISVRSY